jgi:hypothetical protein
MVDPHIEVDEATAVEATATAVEATATAVEATATAVEATKPPATASSTAVLVPLGKLNFAADDVMCDT